VYVAPHILSHFLSPLSSQPQVLGYTLALRRQEDAPEQFGDARWQTFSEELQAAVGLVLTASQCKDLGQVIARGAPSVVKRSSAKPARAGLDDLSAEPRACVGSKRVPRTSHHDIVVAYHPPVISSAHP
jgi:hypothetical protein